MFEICNINHSILSMDAQIWVKFLSADCYIGVAKLNKTKHGQTKHMRMQTLLYTISR